MKKLNSVLAVLTALALLATSCQRDFDNGGGEKPIETGEIPADFPWKTTRDVSATVEVPTVGGVTAPYAVIRIYSSPILTDANLVAKGVAKSSASFAPKFTVPAGVENLYVQTTLPDGTKSVEMVPVQHAVNVAGAGFKATVASTIQLRGKSVARASSMPEFPTMVEPDYGSLMKIETTPSSQLDLATDAYIPAGATVTGNINLNGTYSPNKEPILYVAGKLSVSSLNIGKATLAIVPGGEVIVSKELSAQNGNKKNPALYVFAGGKLVADDMNLSSKEAVNLGTIEVKDELDLNNQITFYNGTGAVLITDGLDCSNNVSLFNDGKIEAKDFELNSSAVFENCENAEFHAEEMYLANSRATKFYQKGIAHIEEMECLGEFYVNCYTYIKDFTLEQGNLYMASDVCLDVEKAEFNNSNVEMAAGSLFIAGDYNKSNEDKFGNNRFTALNGTVMAVVRFVNSAKYSIGDKWWSDSRTVFSGPMEVVDPHAENKFYVAKCFTKGAVLTYEQITNIPKSECNGGKGQIVPDPEPEPEEEYNLVTGAPYTYCFEDNWPWFGDYDMNDVVFVASIDRMVSKDGSKVSSLVINWELKAAGRTYDVACAVQMDKVEASDVASVESSHKGFGSGMFASQGLEAGQKYAVIPFFNQTTELLATSNTWKGQPASATTKHTTSVVFAQPVPAEDVLETAMNVFITAKNRQNEIHMPSYLPTDAGVLAKGCIRPEDPYKFYVAEGEHMVDNYMMWALVIPGDFRYPAESKDIRKAYTYFLPWASSNGKQYQEWYLDEVNESQLY